MLRAVVNLPALGHTLADSGGPGFSKQVPRDAQRSSQLASGRHGVASSCSQVGSGTTNGAQRADRGLWSTLNPEAHLPLFPALWFGWSLLSRYQGMAQSHSSINAEVSRWPEERWESVLLLSGGRWNPNAISRVREHPSGPGMQTAKPQTPEGAPPPPYCVLECVAPERPFAKEGCDHRKE